MRVRSLMCCLLLGLVTAAPFTSAEEQVSISRLPPLPQPVCTENLNPNIVVMKPAEDRV